MVGECSSSVTDYYLLIVGYTTALSNDRSSSAPNSYSLSCEIHSESPICLSKNVFKKNLFFFFHLSKCHEI